MTPLILPTTDADPPSIGALQLLHMVLLFIGGPLVVALVLGTLVFLSVRVSGARQGRAREQDDPEDD